MDTVGRLYGLPGGLSNPKTYSSLTRSMKLYETYFGITKLV